MRFWSPSTMVVAVVVSTLVTAGCKSKIEVDKVKSNKSSASAASLKPIAAKPGEVVTITGSGFKSSQKNSVNITTPSGDVVSAPVTVTSDTAATFVMPEGAGLGLTSVALESNGKEMTGAMGFVANLASNTLDIFIGDASEICSTKQYIDKNGATKTGTKDCATGSVADCTVAGQTGCKTTTAIIGAETSLLTAGNIKSGITIGGVTGTYSGGLSDCSTDGTIGCVTVAGFKSADMSVAIAGNIKSGATIGGVAGSVTPSPANCSSGGQQSCVATGTYYGGTACAANGSACYLPTYAATTQPLKAIDYDNVSANAAKMQTTLSVAGVTGTIDLTNLTAGNIKSGVTIAGIAGDYTLTATAPNAWDVRVGTVVNGVTGKLKVNCRNRVRSSVYNYDGAVGSIPTTGVATVSTNYDYWDTIDDYNNGESGLPTNVVTGYAGWTTNNDCGGVEASTDDVNVWKDITTTGDGTTASTCTATAAHCTMKDKITALQWSKMANFSFTNSTTTNLSATLVVSSTTGLVAGMVVSGTGIPASTYILSVLDGTNLTMSADATATASTVTVTVNTSRWNGAVAYCDGLNHNGATDWRIPTQKELMESYAHGVRSAASANWITEAQMAANYFWSGSSVSYNTPGAWYVYLASGFTGNGFKTNSYQVLCVR